MSYVSDSLSQPFIILDLSALCRIDVDVNAHTAWVQAGATLGELYYAAYTKTNSGYGFPAGICPTVGVGGLISGGGIGTISRKFGTAADNVVDARVVGVDGNRKGMGEDLFWAASFGVVLAYQLQLVNVPSVVTAFDATRYLRQNATKLVTRWQQVAPNFDENLFVRIVAQRATDNNSPSVQNQGIDVLLSRTPSFNSSFKAKSDFVYTPIKESDWEVIWKFLMDAQGEPLNLIMEPFGGQMSKISPAATPFPHRQGVLYNIQYFMRWFRTNEQETQKHLNWMRSFYSFMTPYVSKNPRAAYYNYKDLDLGRNQNGVVSYPNFSSPYKFHLQQSGWKKTGEANLEL